MKEEAEVLKKIGKFEGIAGAQLRLIEDRQRWNTKQSC